MKITTLKTVGDGFAFNHYWPMWSQILAQILDCEWINHSLPGLGNEAISNIVLSDLACNNNAETLWLIQWTGSPRLDLEINQHNQHIKNKIAQDSMYPNNYITTADHRVYWSSSASKLDFVDSYRNLITLPQQHSRSLQCVLATTLALEKSQCAWQYILTYDCVWANNPWIPADRLTTQSLNSFRQTSAYADLDIGETQPVSSIHLDFLEKYVLPKLDYDPEKLQSIRAHYIKQDQQRKAIPGFDPRRITTPEVSEP